MPMALPADHQQTGRLPLDRLRRGLPMPATVFAAETDAEQASRFAAALEAAGASVELRATPEPLRELPQPDGLGPGVEVLSVFVGSRVGGDLLAACPDLRLVAPPARRGWTTST
jgi:hypothetical protein